MSSVSAQPATTWGARLAAAAGDIKLHHSVFALPFAVLAGFMARGAQPWGVFAAKLGLVVVCMVLARTWAMLVNRIADAKYDAANARTARRAIASGRLSPRDATRIAAANALAFVGACAVFALAWQNAWPLSLAGPVLGWLALYSFAKRFTLLCHLLLGTALAISPIAACLAIDPAFALHAGVLCLAGFVTLWVAGFDVLYALQDEAFDRATGLHSLPSRLGPRRAAWVSRVMHAAAAACLFAAWRFEPRFGPVFVAAACAAACILVVEHLVVERRGLAGLPLAFFTLNGFVSVLIGTLGVIDLLE